MKTPQKNSTTAFSEKYLTALVLLALIAGAGLIAYGSQAYRGFLSPKVRRPGGTQVRVVNGSFETDANFEDVSGIAPSPLQRYGWWRILRYGRGTVVERVSPREGAPDGAYVINIRNPAGGQGYITQKLTGTPGCSYRASAKVKRISGPEHNLYIFSANLSPIPEQMDLPLLPIGIGNTPGNMQGKRANSGTSSSWHTIQTPELTLPKTAGDLWVSMMNEDQPIDPPASSYYWDDVKLIMTRCS